MNIPEEDVTIRLWHEVNPDYNSVKSIDVHILLHNEADGKICGTKVDRNVIAKGSFSPTMRGDQPVIDLLLAAGAKKDAVNPKRITAYGYMVQTHNQEADAMQTMPVLGTPSINTPGLTELKSKLMPPGGPAATLFNGGQGIAEGFEEYSEEDA